MVLFYWSKWWHRTNVANSNVFIWTLDTWNIFLFNWFRSWWRYVYGFVLLLLYEYFVHYKCHFVWLGSFIFHFNTDHMLFWSQNAIVISIVKSFLIMSFTFLYVKKIGLNRTASIVAAFLFAVSPIYFRFTVYWPFFSDVFVLSPLLLFSIERF